MSMVAVNLGRTGSAWGRVVAVVLLFAAVSGAMAVVPASERGLIPGVSGRVAGAGPAQAGASAEAPRLAITEQPAAAMTGLHAVGNQILNSSGQPVRLLGANRGAANPCIQGWAVFSGPDDESTVRAMANWKMTAVRVPLNEDCWLGINGAPPAFSGPNYQRAITAYVDLLTRYNMAAVLDLHWSAPGNAKAQNQQAMPDADHAVAFWTSVANTFKSNTGVVFDLYNEPYPDNNQDTPAAWTCLRNGCTQASYSDEYGADVRTTWQAAGMNDLVAAVRSTGATNLLMVPGVGWAGLMSQWLQHVPDDPKHNLAASVHVYPNNWCGQPGCWNSVLAPIAAAYPLVVGEFGETDCAHGWVDSLMPWLDAHGASYLAWHWWPLSDVPCSAYALISDYTTGTPSGYGAGVKDHLARVATSTAPPAPPTPAPQPAPTPAPPAAPPATAAPQPAASPPERAPNTAGCATLSTIALDSTSEATVAMPDGSVVFNVGVGAVADSGTLTLSLLQSADGSRAGANVWAGDLGLRLSGVDASGAPLPNLQGPITIRALPSAVTGDPSRFGLAVLDGASGGLADQPFTIDDEDLMAVTQVDDLPLLPSPCP